MRKRTITAILIVLAALAGILYAAGKGMFSRDQHAGSPQAPAIGPSVISNRAAAIRSAAHEVGVARPKQILFGDLHVHTTFSFDAFQMSLPVAGGSGAHPVADACDYARVCSGLDFWSINDHAITLTPRRWRETVESIRQCNQVSEPGSEPDTTAFLGWEWTQVGPTPELHWGHKNVVLRDLADGKIPTRPISAGLPPGSPTMESTLPSPFLMGLYALYSYREGGSDLVHYGQELLENKTCPTGVPVRDLPTDCQEIAPNPELLFEKLDDWGHAALVIPHGTSWGFYTPAGSSWDKQVKPEYNNPRWQNLIEIFSGHGNSEEYRSFRELAVAPDGTRSCPEPSHDYLPSCWRAGEIIEGRCLAEKSDPAECANRAAVARQTYIDTNRNAGHRTVPGSKPADWQDAGQCRDCFQPAFNLRPKSTVQYILGLGREDQPAGRDRFRFGILSSSDNHSARPGTGYKELARTEFTESRFGNFTKTILGEVPIEEPVAHSSPMTDNWSTAVFSIFETERAASFFLTGGLAAVHSEGRSRQEIWDALKRREVYGTSGPRILLWFDLLNTPDGRPVPMGSEVKLEEAPIFQVRAVGSYEQKPGCPPDAQEALSPDRLEYLCQGECYNPGDQRRPITRIEVVRILPQKNDTEAMDALIEDPWKTVECPADGAGCQVAFTDPEFLDSGRDAVYYVRAIEATSGAVGADPLGCVRDESGRCSETHPCYGRPTDDNCLAETEERAWSSPIFIDQKGT